MSNFDGYLSKHDYSEYEPKRYEYRELNENYEPHRRILRDLLGAAERLLDVDIDRAHVSCCNNDKEAIIQRRFSNIVAPDNFQQKEGYWEFLQLTRCDNRENAAIDYEIINGWSLGDESITNRYELQQDVSAGVCQATVYDGGSDEERSITRYDARQLRETLGYFCRLAPIDPTYGRVD